MHSAEIHGDLSPPAFILSIVVNKSTTSRAAILEEDLAIAALHVCLVAIVLRRPLTSTSSSLLAESAPSQFSRVPPAARAAADAPTSRLYFDLE